MLPLFFVMRGIIGLSILTTSLLVAADDGNSLLVTSPWVKQARVALLPARSEAQLRDGGKMGGAGKRAGLGKLTAPETLEIRWESVPVRTAELKAGTGPGAEPEGDYYAIAVYGVPGITSSNRKGLGSELKQTSFLRMRGKKDLRPARVEIQPLGDNKARILYLFPRTTAITAEDRQVEFVSQIGRMCVNPVFTIGDMSFQGKLEL